MFNDKSIIFKKVEEDIIDYISQLLITQRKPWVCGLAKKSLGESSAFDDMVGYSVSVVSHVDLVKVYTKTFTFNSDHFTQLEPICVNVDKNEITYYYTERLDTGDYSVKFVIAKFALDIEDWVKFKYDLDEVPVDQYECITNMHFYTEQAKHLSCSY